MLKRINLNNIGHNKAGQALLEYGVVLALVAAALGTIQLYVRRTLQARYKDASDRAIHQMRTGKGETHLSLQYEPYYQDSKMNISTSSQITTSYAPKGVSSKNIIQDKITRTGTRQEYPYSEN